jgi:hypothetical protein
MSAESLVQLLASKLGVPPDDNIKESVEYILSIPDQDDLREWLEDGMGVTAATDIDEILSCISGIKSARSMMPPFPSAGRKKSETRKQSDQRTMQECPDRVDSSSSIGYPTTPQAPRLPAVPESTKQSRSMCYCLGKSEYPGGHRAIGNCLACGRIVCAEEDFGDCLYCGEPKTGRMYWIGYAMSNRVESPARSSSAIEQKNRLIQYDREGTRRTRIYDDSTDWFAETQDVWRGKEERDEAKKLMDEFEDKKLEAKRQMKISLDFHSGAISVVDKEGEMRKMEQQSDYNLHEFVAASGMNYSLGGNVLNETQEKILREIRERLGVSDKKKTEKVYTSLFSVFEDLG